MVAAAAYMLQNLNVKEVYLAANLTLIYTLCFTVTICNLTGSSTIFKSVVLFSRRYVVDFVFIIFCGYGPSLCKGASSINI
jgi:hypothetical protein